MKYKHLDRNDRNQLEILLKRKYLYREIAQVLKVNITTVSREVRRHSKVDGTYCAGIAQRRTDIKRRNSKFCGMKIQANNQIRACIVTALENHQSPESIAGRYGDISHMSIYKWLYSPFGQKYCKHLCSKRYRKKLYQKKKTKREMIPNAVSIHDRPVDGVHWEGDLFVSPQKLPHSVSGVFLVEQSTNYILSQKIPNRKPETMVRAVESLITDVVVSDITWDRGIENKYHEQLSVPSYFCDPRSPWQKPYVENNIGLNRRWFVPKGTDLDCMKQTQLDRYVSILNHKWRKSLGYRSAHECAKERGIIK